MSLSWGTGVLYLLLKKFIISSNDFTVWYNALHNLILVYFITRTLYSKSKAAMSSKALSTGEGSEATNFDPQDKFIEAVENFIKALLHKFRKNPEAVSKLKTQHSRLKMMVIDASDKVRRSAGKKLLWPFTRL